MPGKSDVDLFVICTEVPDKEERFGLYKELVKECSSLQMQVANGGIWVYGDIFICQGIDVMPMYFTVKEMTDYIEEVLQGKYLEREGRFYPIGRLASVETLHIYYEKEQAWTRIQQRVLKYPDTLFKAWYKYQNALILDEEDLGRVVLRKEVLFYHQVLEEALDRLLQMLFAINKCYFPSRKRTEEAIQKFEKKPDRCYERLL